jgi:ATP-binding cassette subfamily B protein
MAYHTPPGPLPDATTRGFLGVFRYSRRAMELVWTTNRLLTVVLAVLTLLAGVLPAAMAWVGALIIDAVIAAGKATQDSGVTSMTRVFTLVATEAVIVAALTGAQRGISLCQALLRAQLGQRDSTTSSPGPGARPRAGRCRW